MDQSQIEEDQSQIEEGSSPARGADTRYLAFVGGLLILIIALLAVLWIRERTTRIAAQKQVRTLIRQTMEAGMQQLAISRKLQAIRPINRGDMLSEKGTLNGKNVTVVRISAQAGKRFGFLPGDVVVVAPDVVVVAPDVVVVAPETQPGAP